jgi:hypothetical protein
MLSLYTDKAKTQPLDAAAVVEWGVRQSGARNKGVRPIATPDEVPTGGASYQLWARAVEGGAWFRVWRSGQVGRPRLADGQGGRVTQWRRAREVATGGES